MRIERILNLARLQISEEEKKNLEKDFSSILDFVKKLETLDVSNIKPMSYPIDINNIMREDAPKEPKNKNKNQKLKLNKRLIDSAPETKNDFVKVKSILE